MNSRSVILLFTLWVGMSSPSSVYAVYGNYGSPGLRALGEIVFIGVVIFFSIRLAFKSPKRFVITAFSWIFGLSLALPVPATLMTFLELEGIEVVLVWGACLFIAYKFGDIVFPYLDRLEKQEEKNREAKEDK